MTSVEEAQIKDSHSKESDKDNCMAVHMNTLSVIKAANALNIILSLLTKSILKVPRLGTEFRMRTNEDQLTFAKT